MLPAGERRQATVLFADIAGYTALCATMDPEQVQALLNRFYELTDRTVGAYGGNVIDHAGDGVLAVFGAPVAYGNDPERAVRAALDMHAAAAQLTDASGRPLQLHVGIAAGEVVAAVISGGVTPKYTVTGDMVNLAARLDGLGQPGETLMSHSVYRAVLDLVDADSLGEQAVKGFDAPVRVYRVQALRPTRAQRLPFVGRQSELRQLSGVLDGMREAGTGMAILIRGEPGIGKSRLVEELGWRADTRGYACHVGRILDFGVGKGQDALPVVVAEILGLRGAADESARLAALERGIDAGLVDAEHESLIRDLLELAQRAHLQALFDAMDTATRTRRTADAMADLARRAARERPRLIAFEDIHWGSATLQVCLAALARVARESPLLLAMTTRFVEDPVDRRWRVSSHGTPLLTIDLGPLRVEEARVLAAGAIESSNRLVAQCIERAEGNPLFLEQLLRNAQESEIASIPPRIQSLVLRGDCLAHSRVLFYREAIDAALKDKDWDEALRYAAALEELVRAEALPFATLVAARARALVELGRRGPQPGVAAGLDALKEQLRQGGFGGLVVGIDAALAAA